MGAIRSIDQSIKTLVFSIFWWLVDSLDKDRVFGQIKDAIERNLDVNNPHKIVAPDSYEVLVNNKVFIKHAHSIKNLETVLSELIQKYVADHDYELLQPRIKLRILSSATISRRKADIHCWFSQEESLPQQEAASEAKYVLQVTEGEGKGMRWPLSPGNVYRIGRASTADICLPYERISKTHATLYFLKDNKLTIVDEGSGNGTFLGDDETKITGSCELAPGSKVRLCNVNPITLAVSIENPQT